MRILLRAILITIILTGCGPNNIDFDPFDSQYRFHEKFNLSDHDTIIGECGYWNLTNRNDGTYYQFFLSEKKIVAKGFNITIDNIKSEFAIDGPNTEEFIEVIRENPVDTIKIKSLLKIFEPKKISFIYDTTSLIGVEIIDKEGSAHLAEVTAFWNGQSIERQIQYFKGGE
jgi:hypothetical protein